MPTDAEAKKSFKLRIIYRRLYQLKLYSTANSSKAIFFFIIDYFLMVQFVNFQTTTHVQ